MQLVHNVALEPAISREQLTEMNSRSLRLVVPLPIHGSYPVPWRDNLMSAKAFLDLVEDRQRHAGIS
jgi:hypothetical protein